MEFNPSTPIYLQVAEDIRQKVVLGVYKPGDRLPSSRDLAVEYGINPNTAVRVYHELNDQGICQTKRGLGTFVTESAGTISRIRNEMAQRTADIFVRSMKQLGFSFTDMHEFIDEREVMENGNTKN